MKQMSSGGGLPGMGGLPGLSGDGGVSMPGMSGAQPQRRSPRGNGAAPRRQRPLKKMKGFGDL